MTGIQKGAIGTLLTGGLLGIVLVAVVFGGEAALSTEEFCTSCHSMTYTQKELRESTHYGALGGSSPAVGSSKRTMLGLPTRALAIPTRRRRAAQPSQTG